MSSANVDSIGNDNVNDLGVRVVSNFESGSGQLIRLSNTCVVGKGDTFRLLTSQRNQKLLGVFYQIGKSESITPRVNTLPFDNKSSTCKLSTRGKGLFRYYLKLDTTMRTRLEKILMWYYQANKQYFPNLFPESGYDEDYNFILLVIVFALGLWWSIDKSIREPEFHQTWLAVDDFLYIILATIEDVSTINANDKPTLNTKQFIQSMERNVNYYFCSGSTASVACRELSCRFCSELNLALEDDLNLPSIGLFNSKLSTIMPGMFSIKQVRAIEEPVDMPQTHGTTYCIYDRQHHNKRDDVKINAVAGLLANENFAVMDHCDTTQHRHTRVLLITRRNVIFRDTTGDVRVNITNVTEGLIRNMVACLRQACTKGCLIRHAKNVLFCLPHKPAWYELCKIDVPMIHLLLGCWYSIVVRHLMPECLIQFESSRSFGPYEKSDIGVMQLLLDRSQMSNHEAYVSLGRKIADTGILYIGERIYGWKDEEGEHDDYQQLESRIEMFAGTIDSDLTEDDIFKFKNRYDNL